MPPDHGIWVRGWDVLPFRQSVADSEDEGPQNKAVSNRMLMSRKRASSGQTCLVPKADYQLGDDSTQTQSERSIRYLKAATAMFAIAGSETKTCDAGVARMPRQGQQGTPARSDISTSTSL